LVKIIVKYMLWIRDKTGVDREEFILEDGSILKDLLEKLMEKYSGLAKYLENPMDTENPLIILVNSRRVGFEYVFKDGDEVLLMPPVSGG